MRYACVRILTSSFYTTTCNSRFFPPNIKGTMAWIPPDPRRSFIAAGLAEYSPWAEKRGAHQAMA